MKQKQATQTPVVLWFNEISKHDIPLAGGKGASLGEMTQAGIPVPPGFVVTADCYFSFLEQAGLKEWIRNLLTGLNSNDSKQLAGVASQIKTAITRADMPLEIADRVRQAYREMGGGLVAVRSSATAEDLPEASFAGQQTSYLNVQGEDEVLLAVQGCWASLFESRAIFYRAHQGYDHISVGLAAVVQRMVQSEVSGVLFTVEPVSSDKSKIVIETVWGLGEAIVSGSVTPDYIVVDKENMRILERKVSAQDWKLVRNPNFNWDKEYANVKYPVPENERTLEKLDPDRIIELARLACRIEDHYGVPQDIEWGWEKGKFYILQSRPVTTLRDEELEEIQKITATVILSGAGASPGVDSGPVRIIHSPSEIDRVKKGDVLVTEMTTPDFVPAMKRASAIVTDKGGRTCHAAIVSRELGIPCVVGAGSATTTLKEDQVITVDGGSGKVYGGRIATAKKEKTEAARRIRTATRVYVNLADPELADAIATRHVDGVGLLRAEFIIAHYIREHPRHMLEGGRGEEFTDKLADGLLKFAEAFDPRPVVYRCTDFKTNEYRGLLGGEKYEEMEENPMIGYRGVSRYVRERDIFKLEIEAIKRVRQKHKNLWVMLPFVRTPLELSMVKNILEEEGLRRTNGLKLWIMVEVPSTVILLDKFIDVGIDGVSIGSNDLTQLILGIDRDNSKFADIFDERNDAVMWGMERTITTCVKRGITCSICGQAPSFFPDLTKKLVEWGVTSVSVSPDMIDRTREIVATVEQELGKLPPQTEG